MALILLRHLAPEGGESRCYGRTDLAPGPLPAGSLHRLPVPLRGVDRVVSSPLRRCRILAARLGARLRVPVRLDPDWRELDFGRWEGLRWDDVPRAELDAWAADVLHARPHGGESVLALLLRTRRAMRRLAGRERTLVVTHAGPIRAALVATGRGAGAWARPIGFGETVAIQPQRRVR